MARYFETAKTIVERHGGTVEKFIGDAVMAVFGIPAVHEDDALRAARAALEMRAALDSLNDDLSARLDVRLNVRIGIDSGEVVATADPNADQALVAGEVVNVAARLQQLAQPGEIIIGEGVHRVAGASLAAEPLAEMFVKGKTEPVRAWRLHGLRADDPAVSRRFDVPFVDRDE